MPALDRDRASRLSSQDLRAPTGLVPGYPGGCPVGTKLNSLEGPAAVIGS